MGFPPLTQITRPNWKTFPIWGAQRVGRRRGVVSVALLLGDRAILAGMSTPTEPPIAPETDQERELLEAYRDLDEADKAWLQWAVLTEVSRRVDPEDG